MNKIPFQGSPFLFQKRFVIPDLIGNPGLEKNSWIPIFMGMTDTDGNFMGGYS